MFMHIIKTNIYGDWMRGDYKNGKNKRQTNYGIIIPNRKARN
jgi:hypothetical protein